MRDVFVVAGNSDADAHSGYYSMIFLRSDYRIIGSSDHWIIGYGSVLRNRTLAPRVIYDTRGYFRK